LFFDGKNEVFGPDLKAPTKRMLTLAKAHLNDATEPCFGWSDVKIIISGFLGGLDPPQPNPKWLRKTKSTPRGSGWTPIASGFILQRWETRRKWQLRKLKVAICDDFCFFVQFYRWDYFL